MGFKKILTISRPRFWIYLLGPYLVGLGILYPSISNLWLVTFFLLYFTFPANLLVYGINDIFDYETDKRNPKKEEYENKVKPKERKKLYLTILFTNLPFLLLMPLINFSAVISLTFFLFFSIFYSAEPIRAKTTPFLDSVFNVLYLFPGFFAYYLSGGSGFSLTIFLAGTCWVMAMHAYSAVPDIESDKKTDISTIATKLEAKNTLIFCLLLYLASAILSYPSLNYVSIIFAIIYSAMILISFYQLKKSKLFKVYKFFPILNTVAGFIIFMYATFFINN